MQPQTIKLKDTLRFSDEQPLEVHKPMVTFSWASKRFPFFCKFLKK